MCKPKENYFVAKGSSPWCNDDCWMDIDKVTNVNKSIPNQATVTCDDDVTDMNFMFIGCYNITALDLSNFDASNVTDMWGMFWGCSSLTSLDLSNFDTSNVEDMGYMFSDCISLTTIKGVIDMKSCKQCYDMFNWCDKLKGVKIKNPPPNFADKCGLLKSQYTIIS